VIVVTAAIVETVVKEAIVEIVVDSAVDRAVMATVQQVTDHHMIVPAHTIRHPQQQKLKKS
jgi:hypothetical protein